MRLPDRPAGLHGLPKVGCEPGDASRETTAGDETSALRASLHHSETSRNVKDMALWELSGAMRRADMRPAAPYCRGWQARRCGLGNIIPLSRSMRDFVEMNSSAFS
jgi:hypothetical protein